MKPEQGDRDRPRLELIGCLVVLLSLLVTIFMLFCAGEREAARAKGREAPGHGDVSHDH